MSLFNELKRRNVFKVGAAYLVVAWLIAQVISVVNEPLNLPEQFDTIVILVLLIGFPIALVFAWAFELTPEGIKPTGDVNTTESRNSRTGAKLNYLIIGALSLAVVLLLVTRFPGENSERSSPAGNVAVSGTDSSEASVTVNTKSIAVLPFVNLSNDPDQEYFSDGLSEELLNKLAKVQDLSVAARTSSFYFKGRNEDIREIAEALDVVYVLEGSVRKSGNSIRITAQLIKADDGFHLWSDNYDRELTDIFSIQDDIASSVTTALSITLGAGEFDRPGMTRNVEAYEKVLQAKSHILDFLNSRVMEAIRLAQEATRLDPDYVDAWLTLNTALALGIDTFPPDQISGFPEQSATALEQAKRLAPENTDVIIADVFRNMSDTRWLDAQLQLEKLQQQGEAGAEFLSAQAQFLMTVGRSSEALPLLQSAKRQDPYNQDVARKLVLSLLNQGRVEDAENELSRGRSLGFRGNFTIVNLVSGLEQNDRERVVAFYTLNTQQVTDLPVQQYFQRVSEILNNRDEASLLPALHELFMGPESPNVLMNASGTTVSSALLIHLNDPETALTLLSREAVMKQAAQNTYLWLWNDSTRNVRQLEQFKDYVRSVGFADYWRTSGNWPDKCRPLADTENDFECF